ncbi:hypothetical protein BCL57_000528 [Agromyces flavus]|uniref:DUF2188 domain-containing protein n=1 Tax=Agromyces flavus TaxID=589382 RepID=A0A1H1XD17_9MICO|nr:DUF2188 domain-containing protein [Agromyces flavus]MCP2366386.1 hypothetical protein [Agromyces flavus]GGI44572.1 hypothetical protein GCM10010932_05280 [Agromyces flavus]SDT07185.1 hypothetical protein SAMN04489721_2453 [Agromyces flavus]
MADGDVETISKRGQWVNRVVGEPERSQSYRTKEEAIDAGRELAALHGTAHRVIDADETGAITDEDEAVEIDQDAGSPVDPADPGDGTRPERAAGVPQDGPIEARAEDAGA